MSLSGKITALRTGLKLSQGDVAEKLEVSRQSVSKWETGQSVPELDKIVKLADLFGVSVDELVRDGDGSQPASPRKEEAAEPRVVYIERRLAPTQIAGVVLLALGLLGGMRYLYFYITMPEMHYAVYLFAALVGIVRGTLFLILLLLTGRAVIRRRKVREETE